MKLKTCVLIAVSILLTASSSFATWRSDYQVYNPAKSGKTVFNGQSHDATIVKFKGVWFAMFDTGHEDPGQRIHMMTANSPTGTWGNKIDPFNSSNHCNAPVTMGTDSRMWQPSLFVVGDKLWCLFTMDNRVYFATLTSPDRFKPGNNGTGAKWQLKKLYGPAGKGYQYTRPSVDNSGHQWSFFCGNNGMVLANGRVVVPITMTRMDGITDKWQKWRRDSIIYSDDDGATWKWSPGVAYGYRGNGSWEATVWETDGKLHMISRHNRSGTDNKPIENLKYTFSSNNGNTWNAQRLINTEYAMSRPHVRQRGIRNIMAQNDWHLSGDHMTNRRNQALFFSRGKTRAGFVPGINLTDNSNSMDYPQIEIDGGNAVVIYTRPTQPPGSRKTVLDQVTLPANDKYYIFPRHAYGRVSEVSNDGRTALRFEDRWECASLDLDGNNPDNEYVWVKFRVKAESTGYQEILHCGHQISVIAHNGQIKLRDVKNNNTVTVGNFKAWDQISFASGGGKSYVQINNGAWKSVNHAPKDFIVGFGRGYHNGGSSVTGASFLVETSSVQTRIVTFGP